MARTKYIDIDWPDLFKPIRGLDRNAYNRIRINREVIPIIFVPGIMGSRLKNKKSGVSVWDPDREIMCMLVKYGGLWNTPAQRKRMLIGDAFDPEYLAVNESDRKHNERFNSESDQTRADRGWGGIYWGSYGTFLQQLQNHRWDLPLKWEKTEKAKEVAGVCFEFPVYAFGYNWTDSNFNSGRKLAERISKIKALYKSKGRPCKYVILVSHSMGGLVCRSACKLHNAEKDVLGVIHGMQPTAGAAAAYWRMKAGFERTGGGLIKSMSSKAAAWVLGTNGEEVTCILGNSPGGLELLPNRHYTDNNGECGWLRVPGKDGKEYVFPRNGDPYQEIYKAKTDQFWRLINAEWLSPRDKWSKPISNRNGKVNAWNLYLECLLMAENFHKVLGPLPHKHTYQFYSCGVRTVDRVSFSREKLWLIDMPMKKPSDFATQPAVDITVPFKLPSSRGACVIYVDANDQEIKPFEVKQRTPQVITMSNPNNNRGGGDGTVPESSCSSLKGALYTYKLTGVEHQQAFQNAEAIAFVIKAIRNLALRRIKEGDVTSAK